MPTDDIINDHLANLDDSVKRRMPRDGTMTRNVQRFKRDKTGNKKSRKKPKFRHDINLPDDFVTLPNGEKFLLFDTGHSFSDPILNKKSFKTQNDNFMSNLSLILDQNHNRSHCFSSLLEK